jgi:hypothetical protein
MESRLRRGLIAMLAAVPVIGLTVVGSPVVPDEWHALAAGAVFLAYCIYVFFLPGRP